MFYFFSLRLRKDIRTLFANHSVCNATSPDDITKDYMLMKEARSKPKSASISSTLDKRKELLCKHKLSHAASKTIMYVHGLG
jgi:hypothetical protein